MAQHCLSLGLPFRPVGTPFYYALITRHGYKLIGHEVGLYVTNFVTLLTVKSRGIKKKKKSLKKKGRLVQLLFSATSIESRVTLEPSDSVRLVWIYRSLGTATSRWLPHFPKNLFRKNAGNTGSSTRHTCVAPTWLKCVQHTNSYSL